MRITIYRAFPDLYRKSMEIYADKISAGLRAILGDGDAILDYLPVRARLQPWLARLWDQYVGYQIAAGRAQGDVNHVIDHSFGHLVYSLDARKTVVTFHDATVFKSADGSINGNGISKKTMLSLRYSLAAVQKAAAVIADSELSRKDFIHLTACAPEKVHVVYPGVDPSFRALENREALKARYGLKGRHILHVGHNLFYMNIEGVFRALHDLVYRLGVDVKLLKVGLPFTDAQNKLVSDLGLRDRIVYLGRVAAEDLPAIYNCADVLLYPVLYTGFGLPPLEAMACGTPVVCSNRGSLPEVVGDAALMSDPEDHQQMAAHIAALLTDHGLRDAYRAKGLQQARRYSWDETARKILAIYRQVHESACSGLQ
jgi:glycosyltransferase involved in cell wall biosynthesis